MPFIRTRSVAAAAVVLVLASCSESTEPSGEPGAYLAGLVRGPAGTPASLALVTWEVWPAPDSTRPGAAQYTFTDSLGRFAVHLGYFSEPVIDSVDLHLHAPECQAFSQEKEVRERALPVNVEAPDTVLFVEFEVDEVAPPARIAVGQYCTAAYDPTDILLPSRFGLWVDEISDSIRGRWRINYQMSRGDDYGHFSGAVEQNTLTLDLRHDDPWEDCTGFTLEAPILPGNVIGTASISSDGCPNWDWELRLFESDAVDWHWALP